MKIMIHLVQKPEIEILRMALDYYTKKLNPNSHENLKTIRAQYIGYDPGSLYNLLHYSKLACSFNLENLNGFIVLFEEELKSKPDASAKGIEIKELFEGFKNGIYLRIENGDLLRPELINDITQDTIQNIHEIKNEEIEDSNFGGFENSYWHCYELQGEIISKKLLHIQNMNSNGTCNVSLKTCEERMGEWYGEGKLLESGNGSLLIATLDKNSNKKNKMPYTHFTIKIDEANPELCLGHKTFIQKHNGNVVTKTVVIERILKGGDKVSPTEKTFSQVESAFASYFENRSLNRLSSPHKKSIYNYKTFEEWIKQNKFISSVEDSTLGKYKLSFRENNKATRLVQDSIVFERTNRGNIRAIYNEEASKEIIWVGNVRENQKANTLTIMLEGPYLRSKMVSKGDKPLILLLNYPFDEFNEIDTLTGVIAGIRNPNKGTVARLVVLTKFDKGKNCVKYNLNSLKKFFKNYSEISKVRPPHDTIVSNFTDITSLL